MELTETARACLLAGTVPRPLEAFPRNALYCGRGMPHMKKYKTVKEVCALTGLTGKHLYYFHHERVVRAAAFANYSVTGSDGYKLYDEEAVEKLRQIALYYKLGLKRNEIKALLLEPGYDSNAALDRLLALQQEKRAHLDRLIRAVEHLRLFGTKNGAIALTEGLSLDDLGQMAEALDRSPIDDTISAALGSDDGYDPFPPQALHDLCALKTEELFGPSGAEYINDLFRSAGEHCGVVGTLLVYGVFLSCLGYGAIARDMAGPLPEAAVVNCGRAAMEHTARRLRQFRRELAPLLSRCGADETCPAADADAVEELRQLLRRYFGFRTEADYRLLLDALDSCPHRSEGSDLHHLLQILRRQCETAGQTKEEET